MKTNLEYFKLSLTKKENSFDKNYFNDEIILNNDENELMQNNKKLQSLIHEYADKRKKYHDINKKMTEEEKVSYIKKIINVLRKEYMNLTNFSQSFAVFDASFSLFSKMKKHEKINFIDFILDQYVETRMELYNQLGDGYLQILYDSHAHKRMGSFGARKVAGQLNSAGYDKVNHIELKDKQYFLPDNVKKKKFLEFLKINDIDCPWTKGKQNKVPDAVFKYRDTFYIIEHKHIKEGGGGQDKQMTELVDLIKNSQKNVSYISYLDGPYFNELIDPSPSTKTYEIKRDIESNLSRNCDNYFINTSGFAELIKDLTKK